MHGADMLQRHAVARERAQAVKSAVCIIFRDNLVTFWPVNGGHECAQLSHLPHTLPRQDELSG